MLRLPLFRPRWPPWPKLPTTAPAAAKKKPPVVLRSASGTSSSQLRRSSTIQTAPRQSSSSRAVPTWTPGRNAVGLSGYERLRISAGWRSGPALLVFRTRHSGRRRHAARATMADTGIQPRLSDAILNSRSHLQSSQPRLQQPTPPQHQQEPSSSNRKLVQALNSVCGSACLILEEIRDCRSASISLVESAGSPPPAISSKDR